MKKQLEESRRYLWIIPSFLMVGFAACGFAVGNSPAFVAGIFTAMAYGLFVSAAFAYKEYMQFKIGLITKEEHKKLASKVSKDARNFTDQP